VTAAPVGDWVERRGVRMAWSVFALTALLQVATISLALSIPESSLPPSERGEGFGPVFPFVYLAFSTVGALVASRRPGNAIGWLFAAFGLVGVSVGFVGHWALHSLYTPDSPLPAGAEAAWLGAILGSLLVLPLVLVLLLFPDGRLAAAGWRSVAWLAGVGALSTAVGRALDPGRLDNLTSVRNPLGVEGAGGVFGALSTIGVALTVGLLVAAATSLALRLRRSRGRERQQLKWFATGAAVAAVLFGGVLATTLSASLRDSAEVTAVTDVVVALAFVALPVSAGVAILRHRLYDIDVVINRTLVYGALTATLAGAYVATVLLLQVVLRPVTEESGLAVAGSTLAVAALFRPARRRIQGLVDRRFYRRKYDAARTIQDFSTRLRDEVDLVALNAELRGVVAETMQPAHVSLWLRNPRNASRTPAA
jgi:hypothetical protein